MAPFYATALLHRDQSGPAAASHELARIRRFLRPRSRASRRARGDPARRSASSSARCSVTGLAGTLANDLVYLAGNAPLVLLVMGAITSFIFGMGMTVTACYIFLAIVLAPPLDQSRPRSARGPSFHHVLGHGVVHHAAGRARDLRGRAARRSVGDADRHSNRSGSAPRSISFRSASCSIPALLFKGDPLTVTVSIAAAFAGIIAMAARVAGLRARDRPDPHTRCRLARAPVDDRRRDSLSPYRSPRLTGLSFSGNLAAGAALAAAGLVILSISLRVTEKENREDYAMKRIQRHCSARVARHPRRSLCPARCAGASRQTAGDADLDRL